jgi:hypothetical protein
MSIQRIETAYGSGKYLDPL